MDFEPTDEQRILVESARRLFATEFPLPRLRSFEKEGWDAFMPAYGKMGESGYLGLGLPESAGGNGGSWLDLALYAEEAGRALVPCLQVASVVLGGHALLAAAGEVRAGPLLSRLATGQSVLAPAWLEGDEATREPPSGTIAIAKGEGFELTGAKLHVEGFEPSEDLLVLAAGEGGSTLLLVPRDARGISSKAWVRSSLEPVHTVRLDRVLVPRERVFPIAWDDWLKAMDGAKIIAGAWAVGAARAALTLGIEYAKVRKQFGKAIGTNQAVSHRLVDAAMALEQATSIVRHAAHLHGARGHCPREAAMAKLMAGRAVRLVTHAATLTHGGYGFMEEFDIQLHCRRARQYEHMLEGPALQRDIIADDDVSDLERV